MHYWVSYLLINKPLVLPLLSCANLRAAAMLITIEPVNLPVIETDFNVGGFMAKFEHDYLLQLAIFLKVKLTY